MNWEFSDRSSGFPALPNVKGNMLNFFSNIMRRTVMRQNVKSSDVASVKRIVSSTGFFSREEVEMAGELVETFLEQGKKSGYHFFFLEEGTHVVGYACYGVIPCTRRRYDLYWIAVDPEKQGKGYGRKLLERVEDDIEKLGGQKIFVETSSRQQYLPTRKFYRARGYQEEAQLKDFYGWGDHKVIFSKTLPGAVRAEKIPADRTKSSRIRKIQVRVPGNV
jgi:ribosomal protein S18 acetylase RimI-like enzyme